MEKKNRKKKALAVLLEERIDPISGAEDPTNTEQLSVKSSDPTTDFISRMKAWVYQMFKDEPSYLGPDSSQARLSLVISPPPSTTWRFTFLAWVLGDLPVSVNKWEWGLFKEPLRCHLTFPDIQHLENLIIPCTFSAKDVRIDSMYLWGGGFYTGFDLHLVLFYLTTTTLSNFIHYFAQMDWLYYRGFGMGMTNLCNTRA